MIDSKTINSLDSVSKFKTYSKYNNVLDKKFKGYSLKSLVRTFKNPRQFVKVKFLEEFAKKHPYENEQYTPNNKTRIFLNSFEKKKPKKKVLDAWARNVSSIKFYEPKPDPFRYNPNYNSIFKNTPCCRIAPPRVQLLKHINKKNKNLYLKSNKTKNKSINKTFDDLINENSKNKDTMHSKSYKKVSMTLPAVKNKKLFFNTVSDKNNHAYKFNDYPPRKEKFIETNERISYIEPHDYRNFDQKKVIDFGKMEDREKKSILINYASLGVPSSSYYHPKYEYTDQRPARILFTHQNIIDENKKSNKFLIQKLWTSYNVSLHYQLVDNNKLQKAD